MTQKEERILRDMQAFIEFCIENGLNARLAFGTLAHDVGGLLREEDGFSPRVTGYSEAMEELRRAKSDEGLQRELARDDKWE